ncbi:hypothetical protein ACOME3_005143 [Neoechinorhynchus agilis]
MCEKIYGREPFLRTNDLRRFLRYTIKNGSRQFICPRRIDRDILHGITRDFDLVMSLRPEDHHFIPKRELAPKILYKVEKSGFLVSIPYIFYWLMTLISGVMCNKLISTGTMDRTMARKVFTALGNFLPRIFIFLAGFVTSKTAWAVQEVGLAATWYQDLLALSGAFLTSLNPAWSIVPDNGRGDSERWIGKSVCAVCSFISGLFFILTGTAEVQIWTLDKGEIEIDELKEDDERMNDVCFQMFNYGFFKPSAVPNDPSVSTSKGTK